MARPSFTAISLQPLAMAALVAVSLSGVTASGPTFELVQPGLFSASGAMPNAWADFDNDGDLDEFVGFRGRPNRLYRQDHGRFEDVAAAVGLADNAETRAAAWGDYDGDGNIDLYVGFVDGAANKLYRNDGDGRHFTSVAPGLGLDVTGVTRQVSWIDDDNDGDLDLFIAFRDRRNRLFRNDGDRFTDVTVESGIGDTRKTVGAVWFDIDGDGDLDLFVANQNGDTNGLFRNGGGHFVDVAHYPDHLFHSSRGRDGSARFEDVLPALVNDHDASHGVQWVDFDDDGALDLALANNDPAGGHYLFRNLLPAARARQSLAVNVVDGKGRHTKPGAEVRVYAGGTRRLISSGLVDTGGGYCSQNVMPVHVATGTAARVDLEVTSMGKGGRTVTRVRGINPSAARRPLTIVTPRSP